MFSALEAYHQCIEGCSEDWGDIISALMRGISLLRWDVQCTGGCHNLCGDIISVLDVFSALGIS